MNRNLDNVFKTLVQVYAGAKLANGQRLNALPWLNVTSAISDAMLPYIAFQTGNGNTTFFDDDGEEKVYVRWQVPATLRVRGDSTGGAGNILRMAMQEIFYRSKIFKGLPITPTGLLIGEGHPEFFKFFDKEELFFLSDRSGPEIVSFQVTEPIDTPYAEAKFLFGIEFTMDIPTRGREESWPEGVVDVSVLGTTVMDPAGQFEPFNPNLEEGQLWFQVPAGPNDTKSRTGFNEPMSVVVDTDLPEPKVIKGLRNDQIILRLNVVPTIKSISIAGTQQLTAQAVYRDGSAYNVTAATTYGTSNAGVATVSTSGLVTGAGAGVAVITGTFSGVSGTSTITVS